MRFHTPEANSKVDLTPMLDVVFILLIFFIVTASFVKEVGLDVHPPKPNKLPPPIEKHPAIHVTISAKNGLTIDARHIDVRRIRANLERLAAQKPDAPLLINAHPSSNNDTMVKVMDAARAAGIYDVRFIET